MKVKIILLLCIGLFCSVLGQARISSDYVAYYQMTKAKEYIAKNEYQNASIVLNAALQRPYNEYTTTCTYLAGLAAFYQNQTILAEKYFDHLIENYSLSRYYYDAIYHKALIQLSESDADRQFQGLKNLYEVRSNWIDDSLRYQSELATHHYIYQVLPWTITAIYYYYTDNEAFKQETLEAICYHKLMEIGRFDARKFYDKYLAEGGENSPFLDAILHIPHYASNAGPKRGMKKMIDPELELAEQEIRVAVMLPFFTDAYQTDTMQALPEKSRIAMELYEGMLDAIGEYANQPTNKKITFKVLDSKRDNQVVTNELEQLTDWKPHIIVGDIFNRQSRLISSWADTNNVVQLIPLSPNRNLLENHTNVFMVRPSTLTHGKKMAEYAFQELGVRNVSVWTNGTNVTNELANAFAEQFRIMGGQVTFTTIDSVFDQAAGTIQQEVGKLKSFDGVYIPISDEMTQGLILSLIDVKNYKHLKIMSIPDIEEYDKIDRDLKQRYKVYYTSSYFPQESSEAFQQYIQLHFQNFNTVPSEYNVRGYDIGRYLISILETYNPSYQSLKSLIKDNLTFTGLHQNIDFDREYDNQSVHIIQYTNEGAEMLK